MSRTDPRQYLIDFHDEWKEMDDEGIERTHWLKLRVLQMPRSSVNSSLRFLLEHIFSRVKFDWLRDSVEQIGERLSMKDSTLRDVITNGENYFAEKDGLILVQRRRKKYRLLITGLAVDFYGVDQLQPGKKSSDPVSEARKRLGPKVSRISGESPEYRDP